MQSEPGLIEAPDGVFAGWTYSEQEGFAAPVPTLSEVKATKLADLGAKRWDVEYGGFSYEGVTFPTDGTTRVFIDRADFRAKSDANFSIANFKYGPGVWGSVSNAEIQAVALAIKAHIQAAFDREKVLSDLIVAAQSVASVDAINIDTGWPA